MFVAAALACPPQNLFAQQADAADLSIHITGPTLADAGDPLTFDLTVTNNGPDAATSWVATNRLPTELDFVSASDGGTLAGGTVTWSGLPDLAPGESRVLSLNLVAAGRGPGRTPVVDSASVSAASPDPNPSNNTAAHTVVIEGVLGQPDVRVVMSGPDSVGGGDNILYTIVVQNIGPRWTEDVVVTDSLPARGTFVSAPGATRSGRLLTWPTIDVLRPGEQRQFQVSFRAPSSPDTITNRAFATHAFTDSNPSNNVAQVVTRVLDPAPTSDVRIDKTGDSLVASRGVVTYQLVVTSVGSISARDVTVTDTLPAGVRFLRASNGGVEANGVVSWPIQSSLNPGSSFTRTVEVEAPVGPATLLNVGAVTTSTPDANPANNVSRFLTRVGPSADLSVDKLGPTEANPGDTVDYTLVVANAGPSDATNVIVVDVLPAGATLVDAGGGTVGSGIQWTIPRLAPTETRTFSLWVTLDSAGVYTNRVSVRADEPDPDTSNNADSVTTRVPPPGADIGVEKTLGPNVFDSVPANAPFQIVVTNHGPQVATDVVLVDTVPVDGTPDAVTIQQSQGVLVGRTITWRLGDMAPGQRRTFEVPITFNAEGTFYNKATVAASSPDGNPLNDADSALAVVNEADVRNRLFAEKTASRTELGIGETVGYTVLVYWEGNPVASAGTLRDTPPRGFAFVAGSVRVNGVGAADPTRGADGALEFALPQMALGDTTTVQYRLLATAQGLESDGINRVVATFQDQSATSMARVRVRPRVFTEEGIIIGRVFTDPALSECPCALPPGQTDGQLGIPGVRVFLQDGRATVTDAEGKYSFVGLSPRTWVVRADPESLPRRSRLVPISNRHAGRGSSVLVDLKDGELHRADFAEASGIDSVRIEVEARRRNPVPFEVYRGQGYNTGIGRGSGVYEPLAPTEPARAWESEVRGSSDTASSGARPDPAAEAVTDTRGTLPPLIAIGLLEAKLDLRSLAAGDLAGLERDRFEDALRTFSVSGDDGQQHLGTRASLFVDGAVGDRNHVTLRLDSELDRRGRLFNDIRPDEFYPVVGDASLHGFSAQSKGRLFARWTRGASFAQWGDFNTAGGAYGATGSRSLGEYSRALNGWLQHYESGALRVDAYASRDRAQQVIDELPGRGVSGPYALSRPDGLLNSETVELVTRDRNQPAVVLKSERLQRFADYTIEPFSGRIVFKRPVPAADDDLNPVSIRVQYELESGAEEYWIGGVNAQALLGNRLEIGGGLVRDDSPVAPLDITSVNATLQLREGTTLTGEFARADSASVGGDANRLELRHNSDRMTSRIFFLRTDSLFNNPSTPYRSGRQELGFLTSVRPRAGTSLFAEGLRTEDRRTGARITGGRVAVDQRLVEGITGQLGFRYADSDGAAGTTGTADRVQAVGARVTATLPGSNRSSLFVEFEQDVSVSDRRRAAVGGDYRLLGSTRLYGRHEFIGSLRGPYDPAVDYNRNTTVFGIASDYRDGQSIFSEYRARDAFTGREAHAAIGLRNRWTIQDGVRVSASAERLSALREGGSAGSALTGAFELTYDPNWKASARAEYYAQGEVDRLFGSAGFARKVNRDFTLLARSIVSAELDGGRAFERSQLGIAYRESVEHRWSALMRYEHRWDRDPAATDQMTWSSNVFSTHFNVALTPAASLRGRWASQVLREDIPSTIDATEDTHLGSVRATVDLADAWDLGFIGRSLLGGAESARSLGLGAEVGLVLTRDLRVAAGYNVFGFKNPELFVNDYTDHGFYLQLGFKFDESLFGFADPDSAVCVCDADLGIRVVEESRAEAADSVDLTIALPVTNTGPNPATVVTVGARVDSRGRVLSATPTATITGGSVVWPALPSMPRNDLRPYLVQVRAPACDTVRVAVRTGANTRDPNPGNNTDSATFTTACVPPSLPDAGTTVEPTRDSVVGGETIEFVVHTQAFPDTAASRVTRSATLSGESVTTRASGKGAVGSSFSWGPRDLDVGGVWVDTVWVETPACQRPAAPVVTLRVVNSAPGDTTRSNDEDSKAVRVVCSPRPVDPPSPGLGLGIRLTETGPFYVGDTLTYTLTTRSLREAARTVDVEARVPAGIQVVAESVTRNGRLGGVVGSVVWDAVDVLPLNRPLADAFRIVVDSPGRFVVEGTACMIRDSAPHCVSAEADTTAIIDPTDIAVRVDSVGSIGDTIRLRAMVYNIHRTLRADSVALRIEPMAPVVLSAAGAARGAAGGLLWRPVTTLLPGDSVTRYFTAVFDPLPDTIVAVVATTTPESDYENNSRFTLVIQDTIRIPTSGCPLCDAWWWPWILLVLLPFLWWILWWILAEPIDRLVFRCRDREHWRRARAATWLVPFWVGRRNPKMLRVRAFTYNRQGQDQKAEKIMRDLVEREGWNVWNAGHLGRIQKDRFDRARGRDPESDAAKKWLNTAIETYRKGHEPGGAEPYPGLNALTLSEFLPDIPDWKEALWNEVGASLKKALDGGLEKVVDGAIDAAKEQIIGAVQAVPSYWTFVSLLEFAVLAGEKESSESALDSALGTSHVAAEVKTTLRNQYLIQQARTARGEESPAWVLTILDRLEAEINSLSEGS